jgi:LCP family protein required for cell wall assembly
MPQTQEGRLRARSSFAAAVLSLIFPGLGHAYAGAWNRALAFAAPPVLLIALIAGVALRVDRLELLGFLLQPEVLVGILILNVLVLVYRAIAIVDAWRVAAFLNHAEEVRERPDRRPRRSPALAAISLAGLLAAVLVMSGVHVAVAYYDMQAQSLNCIFDPETNSCDPEPTPEPSGSPSGSLRPGETADPTEAPTPAPSVGTPNPSVTPPPLATIEPPKPTERVNILLIGADERPKYGTYNTDTLIVVSIDPATGGAAMFSLPRDTVDIPLAPGPAQAVFGQTYGGKINSLWTAATLRKDIFPGNDAQRGFAAVKSTMSELYGIDIKYYVSVNFEGFREVVDALGGVTINVQVPITDDRYPGDDGRLHRVYIPSGIQHMDGTEALIYARSRNSTNDFDRAQRQQRVLLSLRQQADIGSLIQKLPQLVRALRNAVHTDMPQNLLPSLLRLASDIDTGNIRSYVFAPPLYGADYPSDPTGRGRGYVIIPNVSKIRETVANAFVIDPAFEALRAKVAEEHAVVWVVSGTGDQLAAESLASYLERHGMSASAPKREVEFEPQETKIEVYNGAEERIPDTIALLEQVLGVTAEPVVDPAIRAEVIVTTAPTTPALTPPPGP